MSSSATRVSQYRFWAGQACFTAKANAICLSLAETAKSNGVDFYEYIKKLFMDLPNLDFHQSNDVLEEYMPWSKNIQEACGNK